MTRPDARIVIAGDSIAGCTAARELRALGHTGPITMIGSDPGGSYARPPLSKQVLSPRAGDAPDSGVDCWDLTDLALTTTTSGAVGVDIVNRTVISGAGDTHPYDALILATGAEARRLAAPGQSGELVLRTQADARRLGTALRTASSAIVVGAGFLGMEVASACIAHGVEVTVVDVDPPLRRLLGGYLSRVITERADATAGLHIQHAAAPVTLIGDTVDGVFIDGTDHRAELVVTCVGDTPNINWLEGTGLADSQGVGIDGDCATSVPTVFAAGDVTYRRDRHLPAVRTPFWSNAIAQGKVAAASALAIAPTCPPVDDYFWTEVLGMSIKIVGPVPPHGAPTVLDGSVEAGSALLEWVNQDGRKTIAAYGKKLPIGKLRALARS
ncbi:NAD(P)/FAD-dependent oxidoreductase [Nocardia goodfellowii]|uniref:NADPH-dependent 2,4-dienoyl-CoA reductase/sulfur reductase-like enzyme n=1 Tax=Nocardia goodfellowii TaxID=882446 RepID=A0ABS4QEU5_9NOCA|nr:NAD(P)/FAD-dependent oxidoreductase [Nocardia goodfellowii]MBP2190210.1 NADPH-dependent 2,4-dienoyl-CoA reductase/sulfur reductase-like enzyme [Nocardia goodfellowii]